MHSKWTTELHGTHFTCFVQWQTTHDLDSESDSKYSVTKYLVNCDFNDETVVMARNLDYYFVADLFLWYVNILDKGIKQLEIFCENQFININALKGRLSV